jgi:hypothetical protein
VEKVRTKLPGLLVGKFKNKKEIGET